MFRTLLNILKARKAEKMESDFLGSEEVVILGKETEVYKKVDEVVK